MTRSPAEFQRLRRDEWPQFLHLLQASGLPTEDLTNIENGYFICSKNNDGKLLAAVGLEEFGDVGLLRSLVVDESARGSGIGSQLLAALEAAAVAQGIADLWLLTIDADAFFSLRGYVAYEREHAPDAIQQTREFSELCPGDAHLMAKSLSE